MKGILANTRFAPLALGAATGAEGSDVILNEVDTGGALNGTLVLNVNAAAASDALRNLEVWTSARSDFLTSGTQITAITSDSLRLIEITSDASYADAEGVLAATVSDLTFSSNKISAITEDGLYVIELPNTSRYVNVQYDSSGIGSVVSATFIGHDLPIAPWPGARTAF